ncbi:unnamed protein product [Symbiodinium natans]|uniref:tRNA (guanine(46)-N(7))-methyltransferase n=1 Tax=Symbiodinium natans TaxID=878477 RepID=A0A812RMD1_9DINO|nr:unnamed protein product [Symbiodinium natans]
MRAKRKHSSSRSQDLQLVPQAQPASVAKKARYQAEENETLAEADTEPPTAAQHECGVAQAADGRWEVRLTDLPNGTSAKSLRAFLGDEVELSSVRLDAQAGQAVITMTTRPGAESCLKRWEGFAAAVGSAPKRRREAPRRQSAWKQTAEPWSRAGSDSIKGVQVEPMESRGFSESEEEAGQGGEMPATKPAKQRSPDALQQLIRKIADFASRRRLHDAVRTFGEIEKRGLQPSVQAYASLINAYVNSGDMVGADSAFTQMLAAGLRSNVVVCTALLKGYCRCGDVQGANSVLEKLLNQEPPVKPDLRLVNTLLRGCVRAGNLAVAESVFHRLQQWELKPDASTCCFMGSLLGQGLQVKKIAALLSRPPLAAAPPEVEGSEGVPSETQEACRFWLKGKCKKGAACPFFHDPAIELAKRAASEPERLAAVACVGLDHARAAALLRRPLACKRALRAVEHALGAAKDAPRVRGSSKERQDSNRRDQELEIELIRRFADNSLASTGKKGHGFNFVDFLGRCFLIPADASTATASAFVQELARSWGLKKFRPAARRGLQQRLQQCLDGAHLRWTHVFDCSAESLGPVHLELGAGGGEWVAAQAAHDSHVKWVALEIMRDRAHSILEKAAFQDLRNICIICGEAARTLESLVPSNSVSHIFINFPEPPFVSGDEAAESSFHMMTDELFIEMHRILQSGCRITILSDNARYMRTLAKTVAGLSSAGKAHFTSATPKILWGSGECPEHETVHGVELYQGWPTAVCGHAARDSGTTLRYALVRRLPFPRNSSHLVVTPSKDTWKFQGASAYFRLVKKAEQKMKGGGGLWGYLSGGPKYDEAIEIYQQAANQYKMAKMWQEAGSCFVQCAFCAEKSGSQSDQANYLSEAGNVLKKVSTQLAVEQLEQAVSIYSAGGRFQQAGKLLLSVAELYEAERLQHKECKAFYKRAAEMFELADHSESNFSKCNLKYAEFAAKDGELEEAIRIFEAEGEKALGKTLLQFGAKEHFLNAGILHLVGGDSVTVNLALDKYRSLDPRFASSREGELLGNLAQAFEDGDVDAFVEKLGDFDAIKPLDAWKTEFLVKVKEHLQPANAHATEAVDLS